MSINIIQRRIAKNKDHISDLEYYIQQCRKQKAQYDAEGAIGDEYCAHNYLKHLRTTLAHLVSEQKWLKKMVKGNV